MGEKILDVKELLKTRLNLLICNERLLFRFGVDRVFILLGRRLREFGYTVSVMANQFDPGVVTSFASQVIEAPASSNDYLNSNEETAGWLKREWHHHFGQAAPDAVLIGGWPFYASIPIFKKAGVKVIYVDFGAVPLQGYTGGMLRVQEKLQALRKQYLKEADLIVPISQFIARSQSREDSGGGVPVFPVLLGADHMEMPVWRDETLQRRGGQRDGLRLLKSLQREGRPTLLNLGRWEPGCYKNSEAALDVLKEVRKTFPDCALLILTERDRITIPSSMKDSVFAVGFPDDDELVDLMKGVDVGISVSQWEGFNLPLAEMQWLDRHALAFDLAAHPEVILHPWYLCRDTGEMAEKVCALLSGNGLDPDTRKECLEQFHRFFTWSRVAEHYREILGGTPKDRTEGRLKIQPGQAGDREGGSEKDGRGVSLIVDVTYSTKDPANVGVIRVTRRLCRELQKYGADPLFVVWSEALNRYVLPSRAEYRQLGQFNGPLLADEKRLSPDDVRIPLSDLEALSGMKEKWLLFLETAQERYASHIRRWAKNLGIKTAAIFYDAIPILRPEFCNDEVKANHKSYMKGLAECDVVIPISEFSARCLKDFWNENRIPGGAVVSDILPGEFGGARRMQTLTDHPSREIRMLCVSTLEPRKNHLRLIEACRRMEATHPDLNWSLSLIGNRYAGAFDLAEKIQSLCERTPRIKWLGVVDDDTLHRLYEESTFTVYPSLIEGYGMPILESLWHGRPCICSREGVMAEITTGGGCLTTDVNDERSISEAIYRLATDQELLTALSQEAMTRKMKTWEEYTKEFLSVLESGGPLPETIPSREEKEAQQASAVVKPPATMSRPEDQAVLKENGKSRPSTNTAETTKGMARRRILLCSNFYPPHFVGGAELIAHYHAMKMKDMGHEVVVFTGDSVSPGKRYDLYQETNGGLKVFRVRLSSRDYSPDTNNFTHRPVLDHFERLVDEFRPDAVHFHNLIGLSAGLIHPARKRGCKTVLTLHDHWGFCLRNTLINHQEEICRDYGPCEDCLPFIRNEAGAGIPIAMRKDFLALQFQDVDVFISPSRYLAGAYIRAGIPEGKFRVIWNGIDVDRFSHLSRIPEKDTLRLSCIGYLGSHKGIHVILNALKRIDSKHRIRLNLVGAGEMQDRYKSQVEQMGGKHSVKFWGKIDNSRIEEVYRETDVLLLASVTPENQPVTIMEAMAAGIPVIASRIGGIPELVEEGRTGFLFEPGDTGRLVEKIMAFIHDPNKRKTFGENGYKKILNHTFENQVRQILQVYEERAPKQESPPPIIVCVGKRINPGCVRAINVFKKKPIGEKTPCVMREWLEKDQLTQARLFWVMDDRAGIHDVLEGLQHGVPLLVPEGNEELREFCRTLNCGLYYRDGDEAEACVEYLLQNSQIASLLGRNGLRACGSDAKKYTA